MFIIPISKQKKNANGIIWKGINSNKTVITRKKEKTREGTFIHQIQATECL